MSADGGNPIVVFDELKTRLAGLEAPDERQRNDQAEESEEVAHPAVRRDVAARNKQHQNRAHQRREEHGAQYVLIIEKHHPFFLAYSESLVECSRSIQSAKRFSLPIEPRDETCAS